MDLSNYDACILGVVAFGFIFFYLYASWVNAGGTCTDERSGQIQITVVVSERRSHSLSAMIIRQLITAAAEEHLGTTGLEFIDYQSRKDEENSSRRLHQVTYLMPAIRLGVQPIGKLQAMQRRISARGFPCAITTDPTVGFASGSKPTT